MAQLLFYLVVLLCLCFPKNIGASTLQFKLGARGVLNPGPVSGPLSSVMWMHNGNIALEWDGGAITPYKQFRGCSDLNNITGELIISSMALNHSGTYKAQINNEIVKIIEAMVLPPVPKPTVSQSCDKELNEERNYCILSCDADTSGAGAVTHTWMTGGRTVGSSMKHNVTKADSEKEPSFHCVLENAVSSETSEEFPNPFFKDPENQSNRQIAWVALPVVLVLVGVLVAAGVFLYRHKRGKSFALNPKNNKKEKGTAQEKMELRPNGVPNHVEEGRLPNGVNSTSGVQGGSGCVSSENSGEAPNNTEPVEVVVHNPPAAPQQTSGGPEEGRPPNGVNSTSEVQGGLTENLSANVSSENSSGPINNSEPVEVVVHVPPAEAQQTSREPEEEGPTDEINPTPEVQEGPSSCVSSENSSEIVNNSEPVEVGVHVPPAEAQQINGEQEDATNQPEEEEGRTDEVSPTPEVPVETSGCVSSENSNEAANNTEPLDVLVPDPHSELQQINGEQEEAANQPEEGRNTDEVNPTLDNSNNEVDEINHQTSSGMNSEDEESSSCNVQTASSSDTIGNSEKTPPVMPTSEETPH